MIKQERGCSLLFMTYLPNTWMDFSLCRGQSSLFFPAQSIVGKKRIALQKQALDICSKCPVVEPCREYGIATQSSGIWGGETEEQRAGRGLPVSINVRRRIQRAKKKILL